MDRMLPSLQDVSDAIDEYHEYHQKRGRFASQLLWIRASKVSPATFWQVEAPKVKWLNHVGTQVLAPRPHLARPELHHLLFA